MQIQGRMTMVGTMIGLLLLLNMVVYALGKIILYYKLFTGTLRFSWQNQYDEYYRGEEFGYLWAMCVIAYWPVATPLIRRALRARR